MADVTFEWDEDKAHANLSKHGISFTDAIGVFLDPMQIERIDDRMEFDEERHQVIGQVRGRLLFVVFAERGTAIRIISARKVTKDEQKEYYSRYH